MEKKYTVALRAVRFNHNQMSQAELAELVGVSRQTIVAIERGNYHPSVALALRIADVFSLPVEKIFYLSDE